MTDIISFPIPTTTITPVMASPPPIGTTTPNVGNFIGLSKVGTTALQFAIPNPNQFLITDGSTSSPVTATNAPSVVISRVENLASAAGPQNAALYVFNDGTSATTQQPNAVSITAQTSGSADVVGLNILAVNSSASVKDSFACYFEAWANSPTTGCVIQESTLRNLTGTDGAYNPTPGINRFIGYDITYYGGAGLNLGSAAIQIRGDGGGSHWDVGLGFMNDNPIKTASIQDNTQSITFILDKGSHTNGIDLSGGTYSGSPLKSTGFSVGNTGISTTNPSLAANTSGDGIILSNTAVASLGNQMFSPRLHLIGQGWETNTSASQTVDWIIENQPVQGAANPTTNLVISSQVNGGGYLQQYKLTSGSVLTIGNGSFTVSMNGSNETLAMGGATIIDGFNQTFSLGGIQVFNRNGGTGAVTFSTNAANIIFAPASAIVSVTGSVDSTVSYKIGGTQVVGARDTGWTAMTGTPDKASAFATSTVTLAQLAGRVMSIQAALTTHGLLGP